MNIRINELLEPEEFTLFLQAVHDTAKNFPDIIGVLAVGSLVHSVDIPDNFFTPQHNTARGLAYEQIRNPGRRQLTLRETSDLDIWICTKDTSFSSSAQDKVEIGATALLGELVSGILKRGSAHWHDKKQAVFGRYYKKQRFYSNDFLAANGDDEPWMAHKFKVSLEARLVERVPRFVEKVNQCFCKNIPGDFLEIRAFPESLFHLRPDDTLMPNMKEDRMPFPRVSDEQWISPEHSSLVLYSSDIVTIYPFKERGRILGSRIAEYLAISDTIHVGNSYGSLVIKPDTIKKKQLDIVMAKILSGITSFNGRIVAQKTLKKVTDAEVEAMYPLLTGKELQEAKDYLVNGEMVILVIESDLPTLELFKCINKLKGPRLINRSYERLMEGRVLSGSLRDLLPVPGEEELYKAIIPTILAKKADPTLRFSDEEYKYYAQNLVHSPDNEVEMQELFRLTGFFPK